MFSRSKLLRESLNKSVAVNYEAIDGLVRISEMLAEERKQIAQVCVKCGSKEITPDQELRDLLSKLCETAVEVGNEVAVILSRMASEEDA